MDAYFISHFLNKSKIKNIESILETLTEGILETLTEIPSAGEYVKYNNNIFTVQTVQNNRIGKVRIV